MEGDKILKLQDDKQRQMQSFDTIEKETKDLLKNLFDFLTFSNFFFATKLEERNIFISKNNQFKYGLNGSILKWFNGIIF
ncbi:hypothetical protein KAI56_05080 [Candidatus Parcubacteria bacterium]|nr:hypothetical protein [Candidatus Parcubacteria bacterium]